MKSLAVFPVALAAVLLSGCGADPAPAAAPAPTSPAQAAEPAPAGTPCGEVAGVEGAKNKIVVRGKTDCAEAAQVLTEYFQKLTPAEAASPQGPGPVVVGAWTCGSGPNDPVTHCSTEDDRQIEATRS
jgi:ABC-type phosphate transport system substrate-binding protein